MCYHFTSDCSFVQAIARYEKKRWKKYLIEMIDYCITLVPWQIHSLLTKTTLGDMPEFKGGTTDCSLPLIKPACVINATALTLCKADVQFEQVQFLCNVSWINSGEKKESFPLQGKLNLAIMTY